MAGAVFCCLICTCLFSGAVISAFMYGLYYFGNFLPILYSLMWIAIYGLIGWGYLVLFVIMIQKTHILGLNIMRLKQENKNVYKGENLQSNLSLIISNMIGNLILVSLSVLFVYYFESKYIKFPLIIYLCFIFGYVASYPLNGEKMKLSDIMIQEELIIKTIGNSSIFFTMYMFYLYYS